MSDTEPTFAPPPLVNTTEEASDAAEIAERLATTTEDAPVPTEPDRYPIVYEADGDPDAWLKARGKPKYLVIGKKLYVQTEDHGELVLKLGLKTSLYLSLDDDSDEVDQFFIVLDALGDTATIAKIKDMDIYDTMELVSKYFEALGRRQGAPLGESSGSSAS